MVEHAGNTAAAERRERSWQTGWLLREMKHHVNADLAEMLAKKQNEELFDISEGFRCHFWLSVLDCVFRVVA